MARIYLVHVSAQGCHSQGILQIKGIQAHEANPDVRRHSTAAQDTTHFTRFICMRSLPITKIKADVFFFTYNIKNTNNNGLLLGMDITTL